MNPDKSKASSCDTDLASCGTDLAVGRHGWQQGIRNDPRLRATRRASQSPAKSADKAVKTVKRLASCESVTHQVSRRRPDAKRNDGSVLNPKP